MTRISLLVKPLVLHMLLAMFLGVAGFPYAIYIPYFSALLISHITIQAADFPIGMFFVIILVLVPLRGILHYGEQVCNHYIAFKLLAILRDKVFTVPRHLASARLEGQNKGNLIYLITSDVEALEVLYAHTISPVLIAVVTSDILLIQPAKIHILFFMIALFGYLFCGVLLPLIMTKLGTQEDCQSREGFGRLSSCVLGSLRGIQDVLQYRTGSRRMEEMQREGEELHDTVKCLKLYEGTSSILGNVVATLFIPSVLLSDCLLCLQGTVSFTTVLMNTMPMASSFGPVLAFASLSNDLLITMASTRRVLQLLDEKEEVEEINGKKQAVSGDIRVENLGFSYEKEEMPRNVQATFKKGKITGVHGKNGSGKPTLLRLIMRFWNVSQGSISVHDVDLKDISTSDLRNTQGLVTQETALFHDTTFNNVQIAELDAFVDEIEEARHKAGIHEFIISLSEDYATPIAELGDSLPGGECQRTGLARVFLHDYSCIPLDEPTSNLNALNEAVILESIQAQKDKAILLISHRPTTTRVADAMLSVESGRAS